MDVASLQMHCVQQHLNAYIDLEEHVLEFGPGPGDDNDTGTHVLVGSSGQGSSPP